MLTRRHASILIKAVCLQDAKRKLQLIPTDTHNNDVGMCQGQISLWNLASRLFAFCLSPQQHLDEDGGKRSRLCCG